MIARQMRADGVDMIDLSLGEPDFDTPPHVIEAAVLAMRRGETRYTAVDGIPALKDAIIEKFRRDNALAFNRGEVCVSNGAKQVIFNALMATVEPSDEVLCVAPYWVSYTDIVLLVGAKPKVVSCGMDCSFKLVASTLRASLTPATRWLILNSPSNPAGTTYSLDELRELGKVMADFPRLLLLSDEIYESICYTDAPFCSFLSACPELRERVLTVNGVSKAYAMTGWRIGYGAGPAELISVMTKIQSQSTTNANSVAQAAAVAALLGPQDFVRDCLSEYRSRRDLVVDGLRAVGKLAVQVPDGAFYAFPSIAEYFGRKTLSGAVLETDDQFAEYLLRNARVAVVPGAAFGMPHYFRLSFASSRPKLAAALDRIRDSLESLQ